MRYFIIRNLLIINIFFICSLKIYGQHTFKPVPDNLKEQYKFNLEKNFFRNESEFNSFLSKFKSKIEFFKKSAQLKVSNTNLEKLTHQLSQLEYDFRKIDLYLFLQYATNTTNEKASIIEDSIYDVMVSQRNIYKNMIKLLSEKSFKDLIQLPSIKPYEYYISNIVKNKTHELLPAEVSLVNSFNYLKDGRYYDKLINDIRFENIIIGADTLDLFRDMGQWQYNSEPKIKEEGERKLSNGYNTVKTPLGYKYIEMIKGLNAFSVAKKYKTLIDENCNKLVLPQKTIEKIFSDIELNADIFKNNGSDFTKEPTRYSIKTSTDILLECYKQLGKDYYHEANLLFDPQNGRLDIVGNENRLSMQGVASVYPVGVSLFYARNYEGFFIDLMLLAHESGHAIQASLMSSNKVSLLNSSGPGYFTESFGKFNELLVSYYLYENTINKLEKDFYTSKYLERLLVLFGSTLEANVEYQLIKGILSDKITTPADLDSTTAIIVSKYEDISKNPEMKGLWTRLETNYKAPLHNINDMLASLLAIHYFKLFLQDKQAFSIKYNQFIKNGYNDSPANLLNNFMSINMADKAFAVNAIDFIKTEIKRIKK